MTVTPGAVDYATLPNALLDAAKQHCRVDFSRDDELIKDLIARSIAQFQRMTEISVFDAAFTWLPSASEFKEQPTLGGQIAALSPFRPVRDFTASTDSGATDVTADFDFVAAGGIGMPPLYLLGAFAEGLGVEMATGYLAATDLPPDVRDIVLKITSTNYENREYLVPGGQILVPQWLNEQIAGLWMPKA